MNEFFRGYVQAAKVLAANHSLPWKPPFDEHGVVVKTERWNLTALAGLAPPPTYWLSDFGFIRPLLASLNAIELEGGRPETPHATMSSGWRDFYQAAVLHAILVERQRPTYALNKLGRAIRALSMCSSSPRPWELGRDDVQLAYNVTLNCGETGAYGCDLVSTLRKLDGLHVFDIPHLARFCIPSANEKSLAAEKKAEGLRRARAGHRNTQEAIEQLIQRKGGHKLPEAKPFWELVRIVFIEQPRSYTDAILFAAFKTAFITGFRVGENAIIPLDWQRWREHRDSRGRLAGKSGGISRSLMLRHIASKNPGEDDVRGQVLVERAQDVPTLFQDLLLETLTDAARITEPLRARLRAQTEQGRVFPEYKPDRLVPAVEMASRMAGYAQLSNVAISDELGERYRSTYDSTILLEIRTRQMEVLHSGVSTATGKPLQQGASNIDRLVVGFLNYQRRECGLVFRDRLGAALTARELNWMDAYLRVGDVEDWMRVHNRRKLPETTPFLLPKEGQLFPHEMLFLVPQFTKEAVSGGQIVDIERYAAIGRVDGATLMKAVGSSKRTGHLTLFARYGLTDEDRQLTLKTHALRHLQNTELFRLGVADAIITKRYDRTSVQQSKVYDHRTLAEDLDAIEIPKGAETRLGPRAQETLRLITANKVRGPIVDEFRRIQRELGDDAAFDYLDAEADGLHVTPYGFCLNSFTVDPCPKHLECFNGCRHFARTDLPQEHQTLVRLRDRLKRVIAKVEATPSGSVGRENQLRHAQVRLANLEIALASAPGLKPFPDGPDLARPFGQVGPTVLDTPTRTLRVVHD